MTEDEKLQKYGPEKKEFKFSTFPREMYDWLMNRNYKFHLRCPHDPTFKKDRRVARHWIGGTECVVVLNKFSEATMFRLRWAGYV